MFFKIKQKLCANVSKGAPQQLECVDKEQFAVKLQYFKQFTMWNRLSRRSRIPDKM